MVTWREGQRGAVRSPTERSSRPDRQSSRRGPSRHLPTLRRRGVSSSPGPCRLLSQPRTPPTRLDFLLRTWVVAGLRAVLQEHVGKLVDESAGGLGLAEMVAYDDRARLGVRLAVGTR